MIEDGVPEALALAARGAVRLEVIRRGGHVFGVGLGGRDDRRHVVVYISDRAVPQRLRAPFRVNDAVPVVVESRAAPRLVEAVGSAVGG